MNDVMRKTVFRMFPVLLSAAALGAPAWAGDDSKFKDMDTNSDGMISAAEHAAGATSMFGKMDANGDGKVSAAEMDSRHAMKHDRGGEPRTMNDAADAAGMQSKSADKIATMDTDGDGMLSSAEHDAGAASMFTSMDTDGNGSLSHQEMAGHGAKKSKP